MRILVTGGKGQLARALDRALPEAELHLVDVEDFDLADPEAVQGALARLRPEVVVNAGAWTAVDACEEDPERAMAVNGRAVGTLAEFCHREGALLVQISTDYVFDGNGTRPYREEDPTGPESVYGRSKLLGEQLASQAREHLILRSAWLYEVWGQNFLRTMLRMAREDRSIRVVDDQFGTPTSCRVLARQLRAAVKGGWRGLFHATCGGETSWHGFAEEIFRLAKVPARLSPCGTMDFQRAARRPSYSVLDNSKRLAAGPDLMPDWREALAEVLAAGVEK